MERENLADRYYKSVSESKTPSKALLMMYVDIANINLDKEVFASLVKMFGKAVKIYGRDISYFAILDLADLDDIDHKNIFPLYIYFCKKRLVDKIKHRKFDVNLDDYAEKLKREDVSPELLINPLR